MVLLPYMDWGNLKLFLRQCKLAEANNPQVSPEPWLRPTVILPSSCHCTAVVLLSYYSHPTIVLLLYYSHPASVNADQ